MISAGRAQLACILAQTLSETAAALAALDLDALLTLQATAENLLHSLPEGESAPTPSSTPPSVSVLSDLQSILQRLLQATARNLRVISPHPFGEPPWVR